MPSPIRGGEFGKPQYLGAKPRPRRSNPALLEIQENCYADDVVRSFEQSVEIFESVEIAKGEEADCLHTVNYRLRRLGNLRANRIPFPYPPTTTIPQRPKLGRLVRGQLRNLQHLPEWLNGVAHEDDLHRNDTKHRPHTRWE
jgi:hypothetical protein